MPWTSSVSWSLSSLPWCFSSPRIAPLGGCTRIGKSCANVQRPRKGPAIFLRFIEMRSRPLRVGTARDVEIVNTALNFSALACHASASSRQLRSAPPRRKAQHGRARYGRVAQKTDPLEAAKGRPPSRLGYGSHYFVCSERQGGMKGSPPAEEGADKRHPISHYWTRSVA